MSVFQIIGQILTLVGSLGLFLFGMKLMSESLQKVAGSRMRSILNAMTQNRFRGVLTGFMITTVIQSSSATTVMIVSFVNAGLLSLTGAIGVIMGANIGTTVTAWIISLMGFKISVSALSLPLIGIFLPLMFSKKGKRKSWGEFVLGFAILFMGLQFLKDSVPDVNTNPEFFNFLAQYTNAGYASIMLFVLIGTLLTVVIQSSSATMALTLVLCYNGVIPFELAAAMVLGENIGTTITANIAAIVANVSAKRAARAHFLFNVFGGLWILLLFHPFLSAIDFFIQRSTGASVYGDIANHAVQENV
ncbi:MAG: Na/Pi cotransporter, partial [Marinilabiliales bacterium]